MSMTIGIDKGRPPQFRCRLPHCEGTAAPRAIMCRKHWRVVPFRIQAQIRRLINGSQVDPRANGNPTNAWKILACKAAIAVLQAQGKKDELTDEFARLAILEKK
jgi:hypothetical protein